MKLFVYHPGLMNSHVGGQRGVQGTEQILFRMRPVEVSRSNLSRCMNAGVRSPGQQHRVSRPSQFPKGFFKLTLDRSFARLPLASEKIRAVVGKSQLVTCHCLFIQQYNY
jgi:hypothetical protein